MNLPNLTQNQKIGAVAAGVVGLAAAGVTAALLATSGGSPSVGLPPTDPTAQYASGCRDAGGNRGPCDGPANCGTPVWVPYATTTYGFTSGTSTGTQTATLANPVSNVPDIMLTQPATTQTVTISGKTTTNSYPTQTVTVPPCDIDNQPRQDNAPIQNCPQQLFVAGADQPYLPGCEPFGALSATTFLAGATTGATTTTTPTTTYVPPTTTAPPVTTIPPPWSCQSWEQTFSSYWRSSIYHATYVKSWAAEDTALRLYETSGVPTGGPNPPPASKMGKAWLAAIQGGCG